MILFEDSTGFLFGTPLGSRCYKTENIGLTWEYASSLYSSFIKDISFVNNKIGFFVSDSLYKTIDGCQNWQCLSTNINLPLRINFVTEQFGIFTNYNGIYKTEDGGNSWSEIYSYSYGMFLDIFIVNESELHIVGNGIILKSNDWGNTWIEHTQLTEKSLNTIYFIDPQNGFVGGNDGLLLRTTDGGISWDIIDIGILYSSIQDIEFIDSSIGYLLSSNMGGSSKVYTTDDGGESWNFLYQLFNTARTLYVSPFNDVYILGEEGTFDKLSLPPIPSLPGYILGKSKVIVDSTYFYSVFQHPDLIYSWEIFNNSNFIETDTGIHVTWTSTGIDTISVISNNFCDYGPTREMKVEITDSIFAEKELPVELAYQLFPNPAKSSITLNLPEWLTERTNISVYNMMGEKIHLKDKPNSIFSKSIDIDISNFDKGVYLLSLISETSQHVIKFIKQ